VDQRQLLRLGSRQFGRGVGMLEGARLELTASEIVLLDEASAEF
jgi:hypothetical protein